MHKIWVVGGLLAVLAVVPASGQAMKTGGDLLKQCQAEQHAACLDFLRQTAAKLTNDEDLCLPEGYDPEQLRETFIAWAADNADAATASANDALLGALKDAFPCEE